MDMLKALDPELLDSARDELYPFADHLTFDKEYGEFLRLKEGLREAILDKIVWSVGLIASRATIVRTTDWQKGTTVCGS